MLNIARTLPRSAVNGPGERFVVWVQGCSIRCPGCWNPDTWSHRSKVTVSAADLVSSIIRTSGIEGVTLTGGEPFEQAFELALVASSVREAGLSVMAYTGYELEELTAAAQRSLLRLCDIVVAGRYRQRERTLALAWRGSSNQRVYFLNERYGPASMPDRAECEVHIAADGSVTLTGFPPSALVE